MPEAAGEEQQLRLDRALQNNAFQTWRLAKDGFVQRSTAALLPGEVPSIMSAAAAGVGVGGASGGATALDFLRTQAAALRNHLTLSCGRMLTFCVAPGTPAAVACAGSRVLLCEVADGGADGGAGGGSGVGVSVSADVSPPAAQQQPEQQLVGDALDASVAVVAGSSTGGLGPWALVSLGRGDLRAVRLAPSPLPPPPPPSPPSSSAPPPSPPSPILLQPLRPVPPLSGARPFVLVAAAVLPPLDPAATGGDGAAAPLASLRVRCVAWAVSDHPPPTPPPQATARAAAAAPGPSTSASQQQQHHHHHVRHQYIRHVCELWSFELALECPPDEGQGKGCAARLSLTSRRRLLRSPAAPHAVQLLLPRLDAVLAAVEPREDDDDDDEEEREEEANDQKGKQQQQEAEEKQAAAATAAAAAAGPGDNNHQAAEQGGGREDKAADEDDDDGDMSPRTLRAAAAALAKFTAEEGDGGDGDQAPQQQQQQQQQRAWAPASDILRESGADGAGGMGDEPALALRLVPCAGGGGGGAAGPVTWRCGPYRLLSAEQPAVVVAVGAAAGTAVEAAEGGPPPPPPPPPPPLLLALSDDVDCAVVSASLGIENAVPPVSVDHRATLPALAYVLAGKTQRRHLLLAPPPPPPPPAGADAAAAPACAAALVEGRRYAYLYGRVPEGGTVGTQEVVDLSEAARSLEGDQQQQQREQQQQQQRQPTVLGARLVFAAAPRPPRLLVLTDRGLLVFELR